MGNKKIAKWGFGMSPISETMMGRYDYAVKSVLGFIQGTVSPDELEPGAISELKGMFNRCLRKDQWDWFSVFSMLGEPEHQDLLRITSLLVELRRSVVDQNVQNTEQVKTKLLGANLTKYLNAYYGCLPNLNADTISGWIYLLSTREKPDVIKIGMTRRSVIQRVKEINAATGVLFPLSARAIFRVKDAAKAEKVIFTKLGQYRMRLDREFFHLEFKLACELIEQCLEEEQLI